MMIRGTETVARAASTLAVRTQGLAKSYGALQVTNGVSLEIATGELHAIIGPNGAGKTTLINLLCGEQHLDAGRIWIGADDMTASPVHARVRAGMLRSYQITSIFEEFSVLENVVFSAMAATGRAFGFWRPMTGNAAAMQAGDEALDAVGMRHRTCVPAGELGYGERRQLELAMALATRPSVLLLDEPMAGMSIQESAAVVTLLRSLKQRYTILLVEHDMDAVFSLADRISVMVYGKLVFTGTPAEVRNHPEVTAAYLGDEGGDLSLLGARHG